MVLLFELDAKLTSCDGTCIYDTGWSAGDEALVLKKDADVPAGNSAGIGVRERTVGYARAIVAAGDQAGIRDTPGTDNEDAVDTSPQSSAEIVDRSSYQHYAIEGSRDGRSWLDGKILLEIKIVP